MGSTTTLKRSVILRGSMTVPMKSPIAEARKDAKTIATRKSGQSWTCTVRRGTLGVDEVDDGEDDHRGDHRLQGSRDDLLEAHHPDRDRSEHAVLDLLAEGELLHERERHRLDALEVDRHGDQSRDEHRRERGAATGRAEALTDLREDVGEDEHEQQRLHDRPHEELAELPPQDAEVAGEQRQERPAPIEAAGRASGAAGAVTRGTPFP